MKKKHNVSNSSTCTFAGLARVLDVPQQAHRGQQNALDEGDVTNLLLACLTV